MSATERMPATRAELVLCFEDARARLIALVTDLNEAQLAVPERDELNPFLWELGHVAWFQEYWTLRHLGGREPICADEFFDSSSVPHARRWQMDFEDLGETLEAMRHVLDQVLERLEQVELDERELYFHRLALFHEDMHVEAMTYMRQTLGLSAPAFAPAPDAWPAPVAGDLEFAGGGFLLGAAPELAFAFDNERDAHEVHLAPFRLARSPVTQAEFRAFVEDGGYARRELWAPAGWSHERRHPLYWQREPDGGWSRRAFDRRVPLEDELPVSHVSWFEADAYCRWAERRLPSEVEWELAADRLGGLLWEWTASDFAPYPGFEPGPYRDYSAPWFFTRKVLRGAAWATPLRTRRPSWRNFFEPARADVLAGFRTAAL